MSKKATGLTPEQAQAYWQGNVKIIGGLLAIWFVVSYVMGIILAPSLINVFVVNVPMGFWFAQQGSILTFVVLIFAYVYLMDKLDEKFGLREK